MKNKIVRLIEEAWARNAAWLWVLKPFAFLYYLGTLIHRGLYRLHFFKSYQFEKPVIVVGNILSGGVGKTPLVIAMANFLQARGKRVGIISRGYGKKWLHFHGPVFSTDFPDKIGDEPLMLARATRAVVWVDSNKSRGIDALFNQFHCDIVISDDGLQHHALKPAYRIVIHPSDYQGPTSLLPAGPFREPLRALSNYDYYYDSSDSNKVYTLWLVNEHKKIAEEDIASELSSIKNLTLYTAIGRPERLISFLKAKNIQFNLRIFPDHYFFKLKDFYGVAGPILMTEKDWIKCESLHLSNIIYVLNYHVQLPEKLQEVLHEL